MPSILYIYKILVGKYQYSIYMFIIYTHIILYPLKYMKAAVIGQSEGLLLSNS